MGLGIQKEIREIVKKLQIHQNQDVVDACERILDEELGEKERKTVFFGGLKKDTVYIYTSSPLVLFGLSFKKQRIARRLKGAFKETLVVKFFLRGKDGQKE